MSAEGIPAFQDTPREKLEEELALLRQFVADMGDLMGLQDPSPAEALRAVAQVMTAATSINARRERDLAEQILLAWLNGTPPLAWGDPSVAITRARNLAHIFMLGAAP